MEFDENKNVKDDDLLQVARAYLGTSLSENVVQKWQKAKESTKQISTARRQRNEARAKVLQRTPYPIIVNRIRALIQKFAEQQATTPAETLHCQEIKSPRSGKLYYSKMETSPRAGSETLSSARSAQQMQIDELMLALKQVSRFLRQLPDDHLRELCWVLNLEHIKREEAIFAMGDPPEKFYIILTGLVEVTEKLLTNDRREKFMIANLKKGQAFGDQAILNNKPRNATCIAVSNCQLLIVEKDDFLGILGRYFFGQKRETVFFLKKNVSVFADVSREACLTLMAFMMKLEYPADTEWELHREKHIYFIRRGCCGLYLAEKHTDREDTSTNRRFGAPSRNAGHRQLDQVQVIEGQAVGTLGRESESPSGRKKTLLQKEVASLSAGDWFGGGASILGHGYRQSTLRLYSKTEVEAFVVPADDFLTYADPELIKRLREDACFRMTYYVGRKGLMNVHEVIGHPSVDLITKPKQKTELLSQKRTQRVEQQLTQEASNDKSFSPEVVKILNYIDSLHASNVRDIDQARYNKGTPTERYWLEPSYTRGIAHRRLDPILANIYHQSYSPLTLKIQSLQDQSSRKASNVERDGKSAKQYERKDLIAASVMWQRRRPPTPGLRQCLTYAEIMRNKRTSSS